jgi:hypothetical protein
VRYSSFKKNNGPPYNSFSPKYFPLEENDYVKKKGINLNEVRMFEPKVRVHSHDEHCHHHDKHDHHDEHHKAKAAH